MLFGKFLVQSRGVTGGRTQSPCTRRDKIALLNRKKLDAKCGFLPSHGRLEGGIKIP